MTKAFDWLRELNDQASMAGRRRGLVPRRIEGTSIVQPDGSRLLNFGSNDYLGVVAEQTAVNLHREVTKTFEAGCGASASALVCGWSPAHERLSDEIRNLEGVPAAVVFPSGYAACSGAIACLCRKDDLILSDSLNHASLIDGCRLSKSHRIVYPHGDVDFVADALQQNRHQFQRVWIVTDSVFSMDGDLAPLVELSDIAERWDANLVVDEAHGTGVLGDRGAGLVEMLGLTNRIPVRIGTLSKAIGHHGGFVAGPQVVIDHLIQFCRSLIFSTAIPPIIAASAADIVANLPSMQARRWHLVDLSKRLRIRLADHLSATVVKDFTPIVPVIVGSESKTTELSTSLQEAGIYVPAIRPPTVPEGQSRLRISLSAAHTIDDIERLADRILQRLNG